MGHPPFSERHGFAPEPAEIRVRHDAPHELRGVVVDVAYEAGMTPHSLRSLVCRVLMTRPDSTNWSAFPNVDGELRDHLDKCEWFEVYDIIEAIASGLREVHDPFGRDQDQPAPQERFVSAINDYFLRRGIGWQLVGNRIETRGPESFEVSIRAASDRLESVGLVTAAGEIHEALRDLARRPEPDITGAIQHALASLECVARQCAGDSKATLGQILSKHPGLVPSPLDQSVSKMWGYGSDRGRHLREGDVPSYDEAELIVMTAAAVSSYLSLKLQVSAKSDA